MALVVGAEGPGLTAAALAAATRRVRIPLAPGVDSLNVATAAAVALYALAGITVLLSGARPAVEQVLPHEIPTCGLWRTPYPLGLYIRAMADPAGTTVRLTELTTCGGCAAKWGAVALLDALASVRPAAAGRRRVGAARGPGAVRRRRRRAA